MISRLIRSKCVQYSNISIQQKSVLFTSFEVRIVYKLADIFRVFDHFKYFNYVQLKKYGYSYICHQRTSIILCRI